MFQNVRFRFALAGAILIGFGIFIYAPQLRSSATGPGSTFAQAVSGAPTEGTCSNCHNGGTSDGQLLLTEAMGRTQFAPGQTYTFNVVLQDTNAAIGGFQVSARTPGGQSIGTLTANSFTQTVELNGNSYLEHSFANTFASQNGTNQTAWTFEWTAPPTGNSSVMFYASAVAADWNGFFTNDAVYATSFGFQPLAVEFAGIEAEADVAGRVRLSWRTAMERNSNRFTIQRSLDGLSFGQVGHLDAVGNSDRELLYTFEDQVPELNQTYVYRVREQDQDGSYTFSPTVSVWVAPLQTRLLGVFPKPTQAGGELTLDCTIAKPGSATFLFYQTNGRLLRAEKRSVSAGRQQIGLSVPDVSPGLVYVDVQIGQERFREKIWVAP